MTTLPWNNDAPWIVLADDDQSVWLNLDHVCRIQFSEDDPDGPSALLWSGDGLWEIGDPDTLSALRRWVRAHSLAPGAHER